MSERAKNILAISLVLIVALRVSLVGDLLGPSLLAPPAPLDVPGMHVLVLVDTAHRTAEQAAVINSPLWQDLVPPGNWRVLDPFDDNGQPTDFSQLEPKWRDALARPATLAAIAEKKLPHAIVSNAPHGGYEGPLVTNEFIPLVQTWAKAGGTP